MFKQQLLQEAVKYESTMHERKLFWIETAQCAIQACEYEHAKTALTQLKELEIESFGTPDIDWNFSFGDKQ